MPRPLKLYIAGVVAASAFALLAATLSSTPNDAIAIRWVTSAPHSAMGLEVLAGIAFWTAAVLITSAIPLQMPRGTYMSVATAPLLAAAILGGPAVAGWVAAIGTTELREVRGRIPWYGSLANHAGAVLPAILAATVRVALVRIVGPSQPLEFVASMTAAGLFFASNVFLASVLVALRTGQSFRSVFLGDARVMTVNAYAVAPLAWLMAHIFLALGWWTSLLFALPLYTTRVAYHRLIEMREMFTQTITALAHAVDKRDPYTALHSQRVKQIAVDIGREMRVGEAELEALEWGGLLHDVGKIGVPDNVLLKQDRLTRDERVIMNAHPVKGAEIIAPVTKLAPELPIIRHHHEWYNGSGYPDRLIGDEIPKLARILHVADAFEAMTAARPYRLTPLTPEQALGELRKFAGIQFDPVVVDAFVHTPWVDGVPDAGRPPEPRPIPLIGQAAGRMTSATDSAAVARVEQA